MTVLAVTKTALTASEDTDGHSTYTVTYRIQCDNRTDGVKTCFNSGLLPNYSTTYSFFGESNSNAYYVNYSNFRYESADAQALTRLVDVTFSTKPTWTKAQGPATTPLMEPWKVSIGFSDVTKITGVDRNGYTIMNSARQPKVAEVPFGHPVLRFKGYTSSVSLLMMSQAVKHCNSATIWGLTSRKVYMRIWTVDRVFLNSTPYIYHEMEFEIDHDKWNEYFVDIGTRTMTSAGPPPTFEPIRDAQKNLTTGHLNGSGGLNDWSTSANGTLRTFEVIPEFNFNTIPSLPTTLPAGFT